MEIFFLDDHWKPWDEHPGALICDCGPFLGEWPPYAPIEIPLDAGEVQILVCLPPPDGNLAHLLDSSYPTPYVWPGRYRDSPTETTEYYSYEISYSGGVGTVEPTDPYIPPAPGTVPGGDAPLMGASASSNATFNTLNSAAGPFGCRRTFSAGLPANFLASPAGPDYAASRDSYWSFKPNPHTFATDSAAQSAFTAYLATVPAGHRLTVITWHEPEDNISKGEFTLAEWKATVNKVAQLVQATGRPELRAAVCFMSYWTFDTSGYGGLDFLTGINWANIDSIGLDPYRYNPGDKSMEQMLTVGNSGRTSTVQSCMAKLTAFGKPFFIAEWGCTQTNVTLAEKARWISEAYAWFKSWNASHGATHIEAAMYFNNNLDVGANPKSTWELSGAALTAFAAAVDDAPAAPPDTSPPTDTTPGDGYNNGPFIPTDSAPPGAHLYIIWYDLDRSDSPAYPSKSPLSIVPQGMVAGSTGPARGSRLGGHWSEWITGDVFTAAAQVLDTDGFRRIAGATLDREAETDVMPLLATARDMVDDLPNSAYGATSFSSVDVSKDSLLYPESIIAGGNYIGIPMGIVDATDRLYIRSFLPSYMTPLEYGADYLPPPTHEVGETPVEYQGGEDRQGTIVEWLDWDVGGRYYAQSWKLLTVAEATPDLTPVVTYRVVAYPGDPPSWALSETFTELASVDIPTVTPQDTIPGGHSWAQVVPLDGVGSDPRWTVAVLPPFVDPTEDTGLYDYPSPAGFHTLRYALESGLSLNSSAPTSLGVNASANFGLTNRSFRTNHPQASIQQPPFHYWVPGPIPAYIPLGDLAIGATTRNSIIFW